MDRKQRATGAIRRRRSWKLGALVDHGLPVGLLTEDSLVAYAATLSKG